MTSEPRVGQKAGPAAAAPEWRQRVVDGLEESISVKQAVSETLVEEIVTAAGWITESIEADGKLLLFGNGGSAADAQHIAAELVGRFKRDRRALPAIALTTDSSVLTSLANDMSVESIFARQVEALGRSGDVALALSTSGNSPNVNTAVQSASAAGLRTICLTGESGGGLADLCDLAIRIPSANTARIQEAHITIGHLICELAEEALTA